jgi:hypothetical protein
VLEDPVTLVNAAILQGRPLMHEYRGLFDSRLTSSFVQLLVKAAAQPIL